MLTTNWNVITGAPSSGKTAVIEELARRGYRVVPEVARALIDREMASGRTLNEIRADIHAFERAILMEKVCIESELPADAVVFLDRGIPDSIAYYILEGLDASEPTDESMKRRYRRVFLFEPLTFREDRVRNENQRKAQRIDELLEAAYQGIGYCVLRVPILPIAQRTDWILSRH